MSAATLMTPEEAQKFRTERDADVKYLSKRTKAQLELTARMRRVFISGRASKDELISEILDARWPLAKLNEAIHVLHHGEYPNSACEWCQPVSLASCGHPRNGDGECAWWPERAPVTS